MPLVPILVIVFVLLLVVIAGIILFIKRDKIKNLIGSNKSTKKFNLGSIAVIDQRLSDVNNCETAFMSLHSKQFNDLLNNSNYTNIQCYKNTRLADPIEVDTLIVGNIPSEGGVDTSIPQENVPYKNLIFYGNQQSAVRLLTYIKPSDVGIGAGINMKNNPVMLMGEGINYMQLFKDAGFSVKII
jgi:hypothetical protein